MLLDSKNQFSVAQAVTATAISDVIDLGPLSGLPSANLIRDIGAGEPLHLSILITTSVAASGGASTTVFSLESDSTANLATSATVHWSSASIAKATLVAGYWVAKGILIPPGAWHQITATSAEPLRLLCCCSPPYRHEDTYFA